MTAPIMRPGWVHRPARPGHPESYERAESRMDGGAVLGLQVVCYQPGRHWYCGVRLLGGNAGQWSAPLDPCTDPEAAMIAAENAARDIGERLLALAGPSTTNGPATEATGPSSVESSGPPKEAEI